MSGKGSKQRPMQIDRNEFNKRWNLIFNKQIKKENNMILLNNEINESIRSSINENKINSTISQKIITSDKYEEELSSVFNSIDKKTLDKIAKFELSKKEFSYYKRNFDSIEPYLIEDLGISMID